MKNSPDYPNYEQLERFLTATRMLSPEAVAHRARFVFEDLQRFKIKGFALIPPRPIPVPGTGSKLLVTEYVFGDVRFSVENARDPFSVSKRVDEIGGTGLNCEDLLYLSKICEIGRTLIPEKWFNDSDLISDIGESGKHLDTLNEVWWLSMWNDFSQKGLERECRICESGSRSVDWRFPLTISGKKWFLNLEIKRLVRSIADRSYGKTPRFFSTTRPDGSLQKDDPTRKFRESGPDEINALAVTWFDQISDDLENEIQDYLDGTKKIDVVIVWAPGDRRRNGWQRFFPKFREQWDKRSAVHSALKAPDEEDESRVMVNLFPRTMASILEEARSV